MRELTILQELIFENYPVLGNILSTLNALSLLHLVQCLSTEICSSLIAGKSCSRNMAVQPGTTFPSLP